MICLIASRMFYVLLILLILLPLIKIDFLILNNATLNRNIGKFNYATYGIGSYLTHLVLI